LSEDYSEWYIEFVAGSPDQRKSPPYMIRLKDLPGEREKHQDQEAYTSIYRYPSPDPYIGPLLSGWYVDFDSPEDLGRAQKECAIVVNELIRRFKIPEESLGIAYSGLKGFHVLLSRHVFNAQPGSLLPKIWKSMTEEIVQQCRLKTVDTGIYHCRALWRLPNSKHSSGYYKIHITRSELENLTVEKIRELATKPRMTVAIIPRHTPEAERWYSKHVDKIEKWMEERKEKFETADFTALQADLPCIQKLFQSSIPLGKRNISRYSLAIAFKTAGKSLQDCKQLLSKFNGRCDPPEKEENVLNEVERLYGSDYHIGCSDLEEYCPGRENCTLFAKTVGVKTEPMQGVVAEQKETIFSEEVKAEAERRLIENPIVYVVKTGNLLHKGDDVLLELDWLSSLSPELAYQLHLMGVGKTGKGKTHHAETALEFIPREYIIYVNDPSPKSFYYAAKAGVKFDKCVLLIDDATEDHIPVLKSLTSQNRFKPRAWSVDEQQFIDLNIEGDLVVWCSSVSPLRDEQGQLTRRFFVVNPVESEELDQQVARFTIERMRRGLSRKEVPPEFEVVKCMTKILKENRVKVIIPFEFDFPVDPQRTLHSFFVGILQAVAKANMFKRLVVESEGEKTLWAQPEDFEEAKKIWKEFALYQMKVDYTGLRILEALPDREPQGSLDEKSRETRPEPSDDAPTVSYLAKKLHESPRTIRDKLNNLYDAGLVDKKWWGSWNTEHYFWKVPFLTKLEEETKIKPESMSIESIRSFALAVNLEQYVEKYLEKILQKPKMPPPAQFQKPPQSIATTPEPSITDRSKTKEPEDISGKLNELPSTSRRIHLCRNHFFQLGWYEKQREGKAEIRGLTKREMESLRCRECGDTPEFEVTPT